MEHETLNPYIFGLMSVARCLGQLAAVVGGSGGVESCWDGEIGGYLRKGSEGRRARRDKKPPG